VAAAGVRHLADPALLPLVSGHLGLSAGRFGIEVARAVVALGGDPQAAAEAGIAALTRGGWSDRLDAAQGLRHLPGEGVEEALFTVVAEDPDYLVRYHAAESLLALAQVTPGDISEHPGVFPDLTAGAGQESTAEPAVRHRRAAAALRALLVKPGDQPPAGA